MALAHRVNADATQRLLLRLRKKIWANACCEQERSGQPKSKQRGQRVLAA